MTSCCPFALQRGRGQGPTEDDESQVPAERGIARPYHLNDVFSAFRDILNINAIRVLSCTLKQSLGGRLHFRKEGLQPREHYTRDKKPSDNVEKKRNLHSVLDLTSKVVRSPKSNLGMPDC